MPHAPDDRPPLLHRAAAVLALGLAVVAVLIVLIGLWTEPLRLLGGVVGLLVAVSGAWTAVSRRGLLRVVGVLVGASGVILAVAILALAGEGGRGELLLALAALAGSTAAGRYALGVDRTSLKRLPTPGEPVPPARRPVLLVNPRSGGGKAERTGLAAAARRLGVEVITLGPGDDLEALARDAVARGADCLGMAGGDGSQALVSSVAAEHDLAFVCIPSGTRNHFALDLGLDRDDVVGALDAFGSGVERRIDLARVNGRVFVNNVSLGLYATVVQSDEYRDDKLGTTVRLLPDLAGSAEPPFDLRFVGPDGVEGGPVHVIQVSNGPYLLTGGGGFGSRPRLDTGQLGVVTLRIARGADVAAIAALGALRRPTAAPGVEQWATPTFEVRSGGPVAAGVDGEALELDPPVRFESVPGALRVRLPANAPGYSPGAVAAMVATAPVRALLTTVAGHSWLATVAAR
ncbi:MAG: diacylglycerol kinase [Acidimicrobiales bacterium]|nr:diacylglycerol kinase [Acidimicrobiales bacterium]